MAVIYDEHPAERLKKLPVTPANLAIAATEASPTPWVPYRWVRLLNRKLLELARSRETFARTGQVVGTHFLIVEAPVRHGKALALDTPIATPSGWTTMGEVRVGDEVFDGNGCPTRVVGVSPTWVEPCYEVTTDDGDSIVAHENHEWLVRLDDRGGDRRKETKILASRQMRSSGNQRPRVALSGLRLPCVELPIDPYVLGAWLGDGRTAGSSITSADPQILDEIRAAGYTVTEESGVYAWSITKAEQREAGVVRAVELVRGGARVAEAAAHCGVSTPPVYEALGNFRHGKGSQWRCKAQGLPSRQKIGSFKEELRRLGVLNNKHIPMQYLRAGDAQRLALLQGLIDTDGYVSPKGQIEFCSTNLVLAEGVRELVVSLGRKCAFYHGRATIDGRDCGPKYRVVFYMAAAARLKRKAVNTRDALRSSRYLGFVPSAPVATRCIEVASPDHRFLAGRSMTPTCNSELGSVYFPSWWLGTFPDDRVILTANNAELAEGFSRRVRDLLRDRGEELFGPGIRVSTGSSAVQRWDMEAPHRGGLVAVGVGSPPTGKGGHLIVVDDPIRGDEQAYSATYRDSLWRWWLFSIRSRLEPGGVCVIIMSRWHEDDLVGRLLARQKEADREAELRAQDHPELTDEDLEKPDITIEEVVDRWEVLHLPALAEPTAEKADPLGREAGQALCPERYDEAALLRLRDGPLGVGPVAFAALYQNNPVSASGTMFKVEKLQRISAIPLDPEIRWVRRWDMAATEKQQKGDPDWTAGVLMGLTPAGYIIIADARRDRRNSGPVDQPNTVESFMRATAYEDQEHLGRRIRVRTAQDPGQAGKALIAHYKATVMAGFDFTAEPESGDKVARATPFANQVEAGNVSIVEGAWNYDFVEELRSFPVGAHDDWVDAAAGAYMDLAHLTKKKVRVIV